jgi:hypothetical protein
MRCGFCQQSHGLLEAQLAGKEMCLALPDPFGLISARIKVRGEDQYNILFLELN